MPKHEISSPIDFARKFHREMTDAEHMLWMALRGIGSADCSFAGGRHVVLTSPTSFALPRDRRGRWGDALDRHRARDARRDEWLAANGFSVLRVTNAEVYEKFDGVLETIRLRAAERMPPPQPSPAFRGRGSRFDI